MDFKKTPKRNIDGFYRPRQPIFKQNTPTSNLKQPARQPSPKRAANTRMAPSYATSQTNQPSLLRMNMPNPSYMPTNSKGRAGKSAKQPWSRKRKILTVVVSVAVVIIAIFGWFGSRLISSLDHVFHGNIFSDVQALFSQSDLKETNGRINILVAGDSTDDPGHQGADLTDTIMVVSINPKNHTGFMFSIPRDLLVYVPGMQSNQKINAANTVSNFNQAGYPKGGMGELSEIIQNDLGIPVDYYALVNYAAVKDAVNDVGGITININSPDPRGLYDSFTHLKLANGQDKLDGQQALDLARARGDDVAGDISYGFPDSDFTRTMYQREMVVAILKKATSVGVITNPLKITSLFSSFARNVQTDMSLQDVLSLDKVSKGMNFSKLGSYTYSSTVAGNTNPLLVSQVYNGQDALAPSEGIGDFGALKAYYQQLVSNNPLVKENASIELLNGTEVNGLAKQGQEYLQAKGILNVAIGDATYNYSNSLIVDNVGSKDPATKALLLKLFPGSVVVSDTASSEAREAAGYSNAYVVILGQNFANIVGSNTNSSTN